MRAPALAALLVLATLPVRAGEPLVLGLVLEPPHLDPTGGTAEAIDEVVYANVFEGLTRIHEDGSVAPALATGWEMAGDGLALTFTLREGVTFHDGAAFTAEDVAFSIQRAQAPDSVNAQKPIFAPIERVEVVDPATVTLHLNRPAGDLLFNLGLGDAVIVDPASAATNRTRPIGTGPLRFQRWRRGDKVTLAPYAGYWGEPVAFSEVVFRIIPEAASAFAAVKAGVVHGFANFPAPETAALLEDDPDIAVVRGATEGEVILALNHRHPALGQIAVRRALAHAVNRQAIIEGAMFGEGQVLGTHFPPWRAEALDLAGLHPHDAAAARALLEAAGFTDEAPLSLRLALPPPAYARRGGELVAAQLRAVGVDVRIEALEWASWLDRVFARHDFDLTIIAHTEPNDIGIYARPDYYFGYQNPAFARVIEDLAITLPGAERTRLLHAAQRLLAEDVANVFLFQLPKLGVWDARLQGLWANAPIQAKDVTSARWRPAQAASAP